MRNPLIRLLADNKGLGRFEVIAKADAAAEVFLYDSIASDDEDAEWGGGVSPAAFVKALRGINSDTIHLRINSPGGSVFGARAMEQALREHPAQIVVHIDGLAASAASVIAMAGDKIIAAKGAMFMIHKAWAIAVGNANDMLDQAALLEKADGTLAQTYVARTGQAEAQIADWMAAETWFTADEAKANGFVDEIASNEPKASINWKLSAYAHAPKPELQPEQNAAERAAELRRAEQRGRVSALRP